MKNEVRLLQRINLVGAGALLCLNSTFAFPSVPIESFPDSSLENWKERSFIGNTEYELVQQQGKTVLRGTTDRAASVLYKEKTIRVADTPWLSWQWKIDSAYTLLNETTKAGDDFPARIYVTAKTGFLPWESVAINYVWSSYQAINTAWQSPYTEKSVLIAVQSGNTNAGNWVSQQRNIAEDFKQFFNVEIEHITGLAIMVDGDNAGQSGTAYFGKFEFSSRKQ